MPDQPNKPLQPGQPKPDSVELLQQILARLHTMEGGLSQHEEWLRRMEQEHHQQATPADYAESSTAPISAALGKPAGEEDIRRLIGALTLERDRANKNLAEAERHIGQYQQEMAGLRRQIAELQKLTADRDRQLATSKDASNSQLEQARTAQADAQRQLQDRQQQLQLVQSRLQAFEQQTKAKDKRIAELQAAVAQAAAKLEYAAAQSAARAATGAVDAESNQRWPHFARVALVVTVIAGLASAGLTTYLYERARASTSRSAGCTIILPGANTQAVQQCAALAAQHSDIVATPDLKLGRVELTVSARSGHAAILRLDEVAKAIVATLPPPAPIAAPPASQPEGQRLAARILESHRQAAAMSQPAGSEDIHAADLVAQYKALQAERRKINDTLADLARRVEDKPAVPSSADVTADQIAKAEAANPQLQAELEALRQREEQLTGRLRIAVDAAAVQFRSIHKALATVDGEFDKLLKDEHPEEVTKQLQTMRESLKTWDRAVSGLDTQWQTLRKALQNAGTVDALAVQASLQKSAQTFVADTTAATNDLTRAVNAISQGQDQTTKRLVLRNNLVKQLSPVTTTQDAVLTAARSAILTDNIELTAIVQRLYSLRKQVDQRRSLIATGLRQTRIVQLQQNNAALLSQIREEQSQLKQRAATIDADLLRLGDAGTQAAASLAGLAGSLNSQTSMQQREIQDLLQLVSLHEQYAQKMASLPAPPGPTYTPARMLIGTATAPSPATALLIGIMPVLVSSLALLITGLIAASRRSRNTIEEYARSLKDMAGRK